MPNVVAHYGAQAPLLRGLAPREHLRWLLLGCVIPDLPWILRRVLGSVSSSAVDPLTLRLHALVQATLLFSVLLAAGIALLTERPGRIFSVLAIGSLLHLLVDAAQTKWGNGVHLFAPVSWEMMNFGWFWPESWITLVLTGGGALYLLVEGVAGRRRAGGTAPDTTRFRPSGRPARSAAGGLAIALYLALPPAFFASAYASDSHSLRTVAEEARRTGRSVEMDRVAFRPGPSAGTVSYLGRELRVTGDLPDREGTISVQGVFTDRDTILARRVYVHRAKLRDAASILGLAILLGVWWSSRGEEERGSHEPLSPSGGRA